MTEKKKQPKKTTDNPQIYLEGAQLSSPPEEQTWRKWKVKPDLQDILSDPPESGIGKRIAYCRGQLDNISVEALSRYVKNFDPSGISRTTIVRYESGENTPGARELRILCRALWIPADWLLFGKSEAKEQSELDAFLDGWLRKKLHNFGLFDDNHTLEALLNLMQNEKIEERQRWIDEARKPPPSK